MIGVLALHAFGGTPSPPFFGLFPARVWNSYLVVSTLVELVLNLLISY